MNHPPKKKDSGKPRLERLQNSRSSYMLHSFLERKETNSLGPIYGIIYIGRKITDS